MEFYEDYFEKNPVEAIKAGKDKDGNIQFVTGDPLIDRWEEQIAKGIMPDLTEGMTSEEILKLKEEREAAKSKKQKDVSSFMEAEALVKAAKGESKAFRLDQK